MYLLIVRKRSVQFSRARINQASTSINWGFYPNAFLTSSMLLNPSLLHIYMANQSLEFTKMHESLNEAWESWKKSLPEEGVSIIDRSLVPPVNNALIFRFLARKSIGVKDLAMALNSIWKPSSPVNVYAIGDGIYLVGFENSVDCNKVLARQPWQLSNNLMVFKKAIGNEKIADLSLNEVPFWVQVHGLEIQLLTRYVGELLGNKIGRVIEVDCSANSIAWVRCLRVRVLLNVSRPLVRGTKIDFNGNVSVVIFRYEKLSDFCYICGKLDHIEKDCVLLYANSSEVSRDLRQYEPWLKADGFNNVNADELARGVKSRGKQVLEEPDANMNDNMEVAIGEDFAAQVLHFEGDQNPFEGGGRSFTEPAGGSFFDNNNSMNYECYMQATGMGPNQLWNATGATLNSRANSMAISIGPFFGGQFEPVYQFNPGQEWPNINVWGPPALPCDAGPNIIMGDMQQSPADQNIILSGESQGGIVISEKPSNKGKEATKEISLRKGRRSTGAGKGKAKATTIGHKNVPKTIWIKRASGVSEGEQKGAKKPKMIITEEAADEGKKEMQEEKRRDMTDLNKGPEEEDNKKQNESEEAEAGETQPRLGK